MYFQNIPSTLTDYVEKEIIPQYNRFDKAHQSEHARKVIANSMTMIQYYNVDPKMVYLSAAYHDIGLCEGRDRHHLMSGTMMRNDQNLCQWFNDEEIETMAQAVEDHRASAESTPRSIYGMILAEADRDIEPIKIVQRTIQYSLSHYPTLDTDGHWQRCLSHLHEKYAEGGYLKLYIPQSTNAVKLKELRTLIHDEKRLHQLFITLLNREIIKNTK